MNPNTEFCTIRSDIVFTVTEEYFQTFNSLGTISLTDNKALNLAPSACFEYHYRALSKSENFNFSLSHFFDKIFAFSKHFLGGLIFLSSV